MIDESAMLSAFRTKFQVAELLIRANDSWTWSVRPAQATLGCGVLSLNRHAARFSEVSRDEMADLSELLRRAEQALAATFAFQAINYLMLMMVDHHVHFHVIPRYPTSRQFAGLDWVDPGWPALPVLGEQQYADQPGVLLQIRDVLREAAID